MNKYYLLFLPFIVFLNACQEKEPTETQKLYSIHGKVIINKEEIFPQSIRKPLINPQNLYKRGLTIKCIDDNQKEQFKEVLDLRSPSFSFNEVFGNVTLTDSAVDIVGIPVLSTVDSNSKFSLSIKPYTLNINDHAIVLEAYNRDMAYVSLEGDYIKEISDVKVFPKDKDDIALKLNSIIDPKTQEGSKSAFLNTKYGTDWTLEFTYKKENDEHLKVYRDDFSISPNETLILQIVKNEGVLEVIPFK